MLQFRAGWANGAVSDFQPSLPHRKARADIDQLFVKAMDNVFAGSLGNLWRWGVPGQRQWRKYEKECEQPITNAVTVEGPHAAPRADCPYYRPAPKPLPSCQSRHLVPAASR